MVEKYTSVESSSAADLGEYYVTEDFKTFTKAETYDSKVTYYTKSEDYKQVAITAFAKDVTYYIHDYTETYTAVAAADVVAGNEYYVKGKSDGGDFGITLKASININKGIEINATIGNMDVFGLPASITAKISNLDISLFNNNFPVYVDGVGLKTYSYVVEQNS